MASDLTCPCEDGLPDPCTLCGEPADGVCKIDLVHTDAYRRGWEAAKRDCMGAPEGLVLTNKHPWRVVDTWGTDSPIGCWTSEGAVALAGRLSQSWGPGRYRAEENLSPANQGEG